MKALIANMGQTGARYLGAAVLVAGLQTGILGYMIESRASILRNGAEVVLRTAPIDPRDLLRGDYVILNYDISSVPLSTLQGAMPKDAGEAVLSVRLKKGPDGDWIISESSFGALAALPGTVVLKSLPFRAPRTMSGDVLHVDYGIERFYVPEGEGKAPEAARSDGRLSIAARVSAGGSAQIRSLLLDGKPVYDEPLY